MLVYRVFIGASQVYHPPCLGAIYGLNKLVGLGAPSRGHSQCLLKLGICITLRIQVPKYKVSTQSHRYDSEYRKRIPCMSVLWTEKRLQYTLRFVGRTPNNKRAPISWKPPHVLVLRIPDQAYYHINSKHLTSTQTGTSDPFEGTLTPQPKGPSTIIVHTDTPKPWYSTPFRPQVYTIYLHGPFGP